MDLHTQQLTRADMPSICALYEHAGRDGAWCTAEACAAVFDSGCWQGVFLDGALRLCLACVSADAPLGQARALRAAHPPAALPSRFLLPPALCGGCRDSAAALVAAALGAAEPDGALACVPVRTGTALLDGFLRAGFAAVCVRPLERLRPHYLLLPRGSLPRRAAHTVRLPLADTLAVSRLLEQGFCLTALRRAENGAPLACLCAQEI